MARILSTDWIPRYEDAGYDNLIESLAPQGLEHAAFLEAINAAGAQPEMNLAMLMQYVSDRKVAGALVGVEVRGEAYPQAHQRPDAPTGLGGDADGVWFSTPSTNIDESDTLVYWYINGELVASERQDVTSNRSAPAAVIDALESGDVVQVAVVGDAVGWWARIEV